MLSYHVLHADAAHGAGFDALKGGAKLVALLLDHPLHRLEMETHPRVLTNW